MTFRPAPPDDGQLEQVLRDLAATESAVQTPAGVEAAVMAAWDSAHSVAPSAGRSSVRHAAAAAACVVAVTGLTRLGQELRLAPAPALEPRAAVLLVGEPILEHERLRLVRMRVRASALTALGLRVSDTNADTIELDVVVGEDGVARAITIGM
jgi:hypothetical protein